MTSRVIVTGASTGLGFALAALARRRNRDVLATVRRDQDKPALERLGCATALLDLTDRQSIAAFIAVATAWSAGRIDALVHNAGAAFPGPVEELPEADLRAQFEIGVFGPIGLTQGLLPALRAAQGRVLFISSDRAQRAVPLYGAYTASKRALEAIAETLALEERDVRVSILELGSFESAIRGPIAQRLERRTEGSRYEAALRASRQQLGGPPIEPVDTVAQAAMSLLEESEPPLLSVFPESSRHRVRESLIERSGLLGATS